MLTGQEVGDSSLAKVQSGNANIELTEKDDRVQVFVVHGTQRELFTEYRFSGYDKPILFPVFGAADISMTRHYPMEQDREAEQEDHPHHKSIWFAHGDVNGLDFWTEQAVIRHRQIESAEAGKLVVGNDWMSGDQIVCQDRTQIVFESGPNWRSIEYSVTITASHGEVVFGDTKEGTFAIRTHPSLRLTDKNKQAVENSHAFNDQDIEGNSLWGQNAKWVHYQGMVNGQDWSMTMMDHPSNLRHPTTWHARDYGLVSANPFGLSYFQGLEQGAGNHTLSQDDSLTFRYKVLFHQGELDKAAIEERYSKFAEKTTGKQFDGRD